MLRARWLGRVPYGEADQLQRALHAARRRRLPPAARAPARLHARHDGRSCARARTARDGRCRARPGRPRRRRHLPRSRPARRLPDRHPARVARRSARRRGLRAPARGRRSSPRSPASGSTAHREPRYTGVWVGDEKIAAIGVKVAQGRTRHGFALNVDPDLSMFDHIVPCGIRDRGVTSMAAQLGAAPQMRDVVDAVVAQFAERFGAGRRTSSGRTSCGASTPTTSARSPAPRWLGTAPRRRRRARCGCSAGSRRPGSSESVDDAGARAGRSGCG